MQLNDTYRSLPRFLGLFIDCFVTFVFGEKPFYLFRIVVNNSNYLTLDPDIGLFLFELVSAPIA